MQPEERRDLGYLWDMREAAQDCIDFVKDVTYPHFADNKMMSAAVERRLEILGEAAGRVSHSFQSEDADIPWKEIKGLRLVLAHRYDNLDLQQLWRAATIHAPALVARLNILLGGMGEN